MNRVFLILAMFLASSFTAVQSAEFYRENLTITKIHPTASNRPVYSQSQNLTRIYVQPDAWGSSSCRQDAADIAKEDSHILSVLLMAFAQNKQVDVLVDDSMQPAGACRVTGIFVRP